VTTTTTSSSSSDYLLHLYPPTACATITSQSCVPPHPRSFVAVANNGWLNHTHAQAQCYDWVDASMRAL